MTNPFWSDAGGAADGPHGKIDGDGKKQRIDHLQETYAQRHNGGCSPEKDGTKNLQKRAQQHGKRAAQKK
jgi:hypothetical protein